MLRVANTSPYLPTTPFMSCPGWPEAGGGLLSRKKEHKHAHYNCSNTLCSEVENGVNFDQAPCFTPWITPWVALEQVAGRLGPRNSQYLCCLAPPTVPKCAPAAAIMTALSPVSLPVVPCHHHHHQPHAALRDARRPPEPRLHLPWIYILIRKLVGGRGEPLRLVMSLFWTPGVFPLCPVGISGQDLLIWIRD